MIIYIVVTEKKKSWTRVRVTVCVADTPFISAQTHTLDLHNLISGSHARHFFFTYAIPATQQRIKYWHRFEIEMYENIETIPWKRWNEFFDFDRKFRFFRRVSFVVFLEKSLCWFLLIVTIVLREKNIDWFLLCQKFRRGRNIKVKKSVNIDKNNCKIINGESESSSNFCTKTPLKSKTVNEF